MFQKLTAKEVSNLMGVSERTAQKYISDIKTAFNLQNKPILLYHFHSYFNVN